MMSEYGKRKDGAPDRRTTLGRSVRGTKDIVEEAREAFASYRGLGKDIIDDLIETILDARQTIANMAEANAGMASERDHALSEQNEAIRQRDEWMARHMDASLQRDAYRERAKQ